MAPYNRDVFEVNKGFIHGIPFPGQQPGKPGKSIRFKRNRDMHGGSSVMFLNRNEAKGGGRGVHYSIPKEINNYNGVHHTNDRKGKPANKPKHRFFRGKWMPENAIRRLLPESNNFRNRVVTDPIELARVLRSNERAVDYVANFEYIKQKLNKRQRDINRRKRQEVNNKLLKEARSESGKRKASSERRRKKVNDPLIKQARSESRKRKESSERRRKSKERKEKEGESSKLNQEKLEILQRKKNENKATVAALEKELVGLEKELAKLRKKKKPKAVDERMIIFLEKNIPAKKRERNRKQQKINQNNK